MERERRNGHLSRTRFLALVGVVDGWRLVLDEEFLLNLADRLHQVSFVHFFDRSGEHVGQCCMSCWNEADTRKSLATMTFEPISFPMHRFFSFKYIFLFIVIYIWKLDMPPDHTVGILKSAKFTNPVLHCRDFRLINSNA